MKRLSLLTKKGVDHNVGDQTLTFYPVSVTVYSGLKSTLKPIAEVIAVLTRKTHTDTGQTVHQAQGETITRIDPIAPEMAKLRHDLQSNAVSNALETVFSPDTLRDVAKVLMDSLRDHCPRNPTVQQIDDFVGELDLGSVMDLVTGFTKANAGVFGPLGLSLAKLAETKIRGMAGENQTQSDESDVA